jgi:hypothetical protein
MRNEIEQLKDTLEQWNSTSSARIAAPSVTSNTVLTCRGTAVSAPPSGGKKMLFSEVLCGKNEERTS